MEVKKQLNCPAEYVYNEIINSVVYDIKRTTGYRVKKDHLKDYSYTKQFHDGSTGTITILEQKINECYVFETKTAKNTFTSGYQFIPLDEFHCEIHFKEEFISHGLFQKMNDLLMRLLFQHSKKHHFLQMLEKMEEQYQEKRFKEDADRLKS